MAVSPHRASVNDHKLAYTPSPTARSTNIDREPSPCAPIKQENPAVTPSQTERPATMEERKSKIKSKRAELSEMLAKRTAEGLCCQKIVAKIDKLDDQLLDLIDDDSL